MVKQSRAGYPLWHLVADLILTVLALFLASVLRPTLPFGRPLEADYPGLSPFVYVLVVFIWGVVFMLFSVYAPRPRRTIDEVQFFFVAVTFATLALAGMLYFTVREISRLEILTFYILDLVLLIGYRLILRLVDRPQRARSRVLVLGAGEAGRDVMDMVTRHQWAELEPVGYLDDDVAPQTEVAGLPVLGRTDQVAHCVEMEGIDEVVVALPEYAQDQVPDIIGKLRGLPVQVRIIPDHVKTILYRTQAEEFAGLPMLTLRQPTLDPFERQVKRACDLVLGTIGLVLALPIMAVVAVAIRLDSPGPVFYRQQRVGENGLLFVMYKFRTMVAGAEEQLEEQIRLSEGGQLLFKHPDDPRVTRVGRFLRRYSLDESPQFVNVLKGDMSLVGPRPELPWLVEHYEPWQWQRLAVPQGLTGWWQVNGRSDKPMHLHTEEDLYYIHNYSFVLDIQILWRTVGAVIMGRGAF